MKKKIISVLLICGVIAIMLLIVSCYLPNIHPLSPDKKNEDLSSQFLVPEHEAYMQASVVSKLVPLYGGQYYSDADFWPESTVNETPLELYDTNGILYQYLFTVSNETRKLGVIAVAANKSLGMPVMAIDDGYNYYLHYYRYDSGRSREELREYIDNNYPGAENPEIKDYIHDLFTVSAGFLPDDSDRENLIINRQGRIYNMSLTRWNKTTPVVNYYDPRYIPERAGEWEEMNKLFNETYNELNAEGINLSRPLSEEEMEYFSEFARENEELYNASNRCRPFSLPPVYPEDEPVSKLFHESGFEGISYYRCLNLFFNADVSDEEIEAEITNTTNESKIISLRITHPETIKRIYVELPIDEYNEIRSDLILYSRPMKYYRVSGDNITVFFSGKREDIPPLISGKYNFTDAKMAVFSFEAGTDESYVEEQRKKFESNEKVIVAGYE